MSTRTGISASEMLDDVESVQFYPELCILTKSASGTATRRKGNPVRTTRSSRRPTRDYPGPLRRVERRQRMLVEPVLDDSTPESSSSPPSTASESK